MEGLGRSPVLCAAVTSTLERGLGKAAAHLSQSLGELRQGTASWDGFRCDSPVARAWEQAVGVRGCILLPPVPALHALGAETAVTDGVQASDEKEHLQNSA